MNKVVTLYSEPCLSINGENFIHHSNGGGLKACSAQVEESVYLGPQVIVKSGAKIFGKDIRISGNVEIPSNAEIIGDGISIFGYGHLRLPKNICKKNFEISGSGRWFDV